MNWIFYVLAIAALLFVFFIIFKLIKGAIKGIILLSGVPEEIFEDE